MLGRKGVLIRHSPGTRWIERVILLKYNDTLYEGKVTGKDTASEGPLFFVDSLEGEMTYIFQAPLLGGDHAVQWCLGEMGLLYTFRELSLHWTQGEGVE